VAVAAITGSTVTINSTLETTAYAGGTVTADPADATNPRRDLVYYDQTGAVDIATGTATAVTSTTGPALPILTADQIAVAELYVDANAVTIEAGDITDRRQAKVAAPAINLAASSDTPVTTTSTVAADIVGITGLSIPVTSKVIVEIGFSKDAGAVGDVYLALTVNSTAVKTLIAVSSSTQRTENGVMKFEFGPRTAATPGLALITNYARTATGHVALATDVSNALVAAMPIATITSLTIRGATTTGIILAVDWYRVWELPV
jgi:hypothetical protein